jgi:hypothetical protein
VLKSLHMRDASEGMALNCLTGIIRTRPLEEVSMKHSRGQLARGALVFLLAGAGSTSAQEQNISCEDVPAAARAAFEKAYPKATIRGCAQEVEDGKTAYEIASMEGETGRDVLFYADGTLIVVEETIALGEVPRPVQDALHKDYSDEEVRLAEKIMRDGTVLYEFQIEREGEPIEIAFDPNGDPVEIVPDPAGTDVKQ